MPCCASGAFAFLPGLVLVRAAIAVGLLAGAATAHAELFACAGNSIRIFADGASGNDAPLRTIEGMTTGVNECYDVAYDAVHDEIVVAHGPVSTFSGGASGNATPLRKISGDMTGIGFAASIAIDAQGDELIVGSTGGSGPVILVFARTADGNAVPLRSFAPLGIDVPVALYVDRIRDEIIISRFGDPGLVYYFDRLSGSVVGNRDPDSATVPRGLYVDALSGALTVVSSSGVLTFDHGGSLTRSFNYPPALTAPWGLGVLSDGEAWVGNQSSVSTDPDPLLLFAAGSQGSPAPTRQINSGAPASGKLYGIASSRSQDCGAGHVACDSVFRANFDITFR